MHLNAFIAKRYLFSKKRQSAVNIISLIAIIGMAIGTAALIIVMSVFNGIDSVIKMSEASVTPAVTIYPQNGRFIERDSFLLEKIGEIEGINHIHSVIQEPIVIKFKGSIRPVVIKGVSPHYIQQTDLQDKIVGGGAYLTSPEGEDAIIAGYGVAADMDLEFRRDNPILLCYPDKNANSASLSALSMIESRLAGVFSYNQEIDNKVIYADYKVAERLLKCGGQESKIEIFANDSDIEQIKAALEEIIPDNRYCSDKYEENKSFYAMMKSEKLAVFLIMLFIILIASFNIIASISMLMLDKKEDSLIYSSMGFACSDIKKIFHIQGVGIISIGIISGFVIGCTLALVQEHFGIITLGDGNYITSAYPVELQGGDLLTIFATVCTIGYIATTIPVHFLTNKWFKQQ